VVNQHAGGPQAIRPLLAENCVEIDMGLKGEKHRQGGSHQDQVQKEPGQNFSE
jgi:hypothetical protein